MNRLSKDKWQQQKNSSSPEKKSPAKSRILYLILGIILILILAIFIQNNYNNSNRFSTKDDFIMDTFVTQRVYGENAEDCALLVSKALRNLERGLSLYIDTSEIAQLNAQAGKSYVPFSEEYYKLMKQAYAACKQSDGLFDITIAPLTKLWDITGEDPHVPDEKDIETAKELVNYEDLLFDNQNQSIMLKREGQSVDLGGIAKGYACTVAKSIYEKNGITSAILSVGGNTLVLGQKPDGSDFEIGVRDPRGEANEYIGTLVMPGKVMATSGDYERYFIENGKRYCHILDPRTGYASDSDLISVTIVAEDGTLTDYLSTTLFVGGKDYTLERMNQEDYSVIAVDHQQNVYISSSLKRSFTPNPQKTEYTYHWI